MINSVTKVLLIISSVLLLFGCSNKKIELLGYVPDLDYISGARNLNNQVTNIAIVPTIGQAALLSASELDKHVQTPTKNIVVSSTVNVNHFRESSDFGRLYSDAMITNFIRLGWNVIDFRGVKLFVQAKKGEFYLDRSKFKDVPGDSLVYVATYGEYKRGLLINSRILDYHTNKVLTAASVQLNDANSVSLSRLSNCEDLACEKHTHSQKENFRIGLQQDDCSNLTRCECSNPDACLSEACSSECKRK